MSSIESIATPTRPTSPPPADGRSRTPSGGEVEGDAQAAHALIEQVPVPAIGLGRRPEPRVLPHRPEASAVHGRLDAAREREHAGIRELAVRVPAAEVLRIEEIAYVVGHELIYPGSCVIARPDMVSSGGKRAETLLDIAIRPIDTCRGRVYNDPTVPRCNSFNMHTLGAPSQPPSRGGLCRGDATGDQLRRR
jgi:hypothetical protein